jgi:CHAT domain-containing protein/uncharacterized protein HemY
MIMVENEVRRMDKLPVVNTSILIALFVSIPLFFSLPASGQASIILTRSQSEAGQVRRTQSGKNFYALEAGRPVEREIAGEEVHTYEVSVSAGQYLYVVVDEARANVIARLFGPDGKALLEVDSIWRGKEHVTWVAETSGTHRLEVTPRTTEAPKERYAISLKDLRDATAKDRVRVLAEQTLLEGQTISLRDEAGESQLAAMQKFEQARDLFQQVGASDRVIVSLMRIGYILGTLTQYQKALDIYNQALSLSRNVGDRRQETLALFNTGAILSELGEQQRAIDVYLQVLPVEKALGFSSQLTYINLGVANLPIGEYQKALEYFNQAEAMGSSAKGICGIGTTYFSMGEYQTALEFLNQALETSRKTRNPYIEAESLMNIGSTYFALGEFNSALKAFNEVLPLHRKMQDGAYEAATLAYIGEVHQNRLEHRTALDYYIQALTLARAGGYFQQEADILPMLGDAYRYLGERQKAAEIYNSVLQMSAVIPDGEIKSLYGLAALALEEGRLREARIRIESAIRVIESLRGNVASPELRASFFATKQQPYLFYISLLMKLYKEAFAEGFDALAFQASEKVHARSLLELLPEALGNIRAGADPQLVAQERSLQRLLNGKAERQLRLLNDKHTPEQADEIKKEIERVMADLERTQSTIRTSSPHYAALTHPQPLTLKEVQQQVLDPDTLLLEYSLGDEHSYLWVISETDITSFVLAKRADIETAARRAYELLSAPHQAIKGETPKQRLARLARAETDYADASASLSRMIIAPAAAMLGKKRLVIVADGALQYVPFAALPVAVTGDAARNRRPSTNHRPLILDHEVVSLPSASVLAVLRRETARRVPAAKSTAVFADPVFDKDDDRVHKTSSSQAAAVKDDSASTLTKRALRDAELGGGVAVPRLPFTRQEAEAITALTPADATLKALGFKASLATARSPELSQYRIVHFATHAILNASHPQLSGLLLSLVDEQGEPKDGFLSLNEVYNLNLSADLVVLSACQTAMGKEMRGEGLIGLTRGFMYAGARRVVASLWRVDDAATAELVKRFYHAMLKDGKPPSAALRTAQLEMSRRKLWNSPFFWAGFVLQGEWR